MKRIPTILVLLFMMNSPTVTLARLKTQFGINEMFNDADVIVKADVLQTKAIGAAKFSDSDVRDVYLKNHVMALSPDENTATIRVSRKIKGELPSDRVDVHFYSSDKERLTDLSQNESVILFLKKRNGAMFLLDIDGGKLPATKQQSPASTSFPDAKARMIDELRLMTTDSDARVIEAGLDGLSQFPEVDSRDIFSTFSKDARADIRARAIAARVRSGDALAGSEMVGVLKSGRLNTSAPADSEDQQTRMSFMSSIDRIGKARDTRQVPALLQIVDHKDRGIRLSAMHALRKIQSPDSIPTLVKLIDDPDKFVEYLAVMTLCEMNSPGGKGKGCPSTDTFNKSPEQYKTQWKSWWDKQNKK